MKKRVNIKETIKKKIEIRNKEFIYLDKHRNQKFTIQSSIYTHAPVTLISKSMNERDKLRIYGSSNPHKANNKNITISNGTIYKKKIYVDYDVVICIPSYDRYKKIKRLISQFYQQPTKYSFKIVLLNDGTDNFWYDKLIEKFPEIFYLKNNVPNGKILHWYCYNQMWEFLKTISCHAILQMDDDFILSDNFLNTIVDLFFELKIKNNGIKAIAPHLWSFSEKSNYESWWILKDFVDGIALLDDEVIKFMEYKMKPVDAAVVCRAGAPVRAWTQISEAIKKMNGTVYRTESSLVYHDGNDDSKLHGDIRKEGKAGVYTQKYIGKL